jgi:hypothetical protein
VQKIKPPLGFDPRTIQPVARRYTNCAILSPTAIFYETNIKTSLIAALFAFTNSSLRVSIYQFQYGTLLMQICFKIKAFVDILTNGTT